MTPPSPPVTTVAPPRASSVADLLGPLEDAVRLRSARIAVADDGDVGRPCAAIGSISHPAGPSEREGRQRLISGGSGSRGGCASGASSSTASVPSGADADAASIQPRRSTGSAPRTRQRDVRADAARRRRAAERAARSSASAASRPSGSATPYHSTRALPGAGKAPRRPGRDAHRRVRGGHARDPALRSRRPHRARPSRGRQASGASASGRTQRSPSARGSRPPAPRRQSGERRSQARRRAAPRRSSASARSSVRQARVDDRQQLVERPDDRHAVRDIIGR